MLGKLRNGLLCLAICKMWYEWHQTSPITDAAWATIDISVKGA